MNGVKCLHTTSHVIVHVTVKQPDSHTVWNHLHSCKDSGKEIVHVLTMVANCNRFLSKYLEIKMKRIGINSQINYIISIYSLLCNFHLTYLVYLKANISNKIILILKKNISSDGVIGIILSACLLTRHCYNTQNKPVETIASVVQQKYVFLYRLLRR